MHRVYMVQNLPPGTVCGDEACLYCFRIYLKGTVCQGVQLVYMVSKPTCWGLSVGDVVCFYGFLNYLPRLLARGAASLYGFKTFLKGPVHLWCSLFIKFLNKPTRDCPPEVQPLIQFLNLSPGDCKPGCSQCIWFPPGYRLFIRSKIDFQGTVRARAVCL